MADGIAGGRPVEMAGGIAGGFARPWLELYHPASCMLARRISTLPAPSHPDLPSADAAGGLPTELWVVIAAHVSVGLLESQSALKCIGRLACTCHALRPLGWHQELWAQLARVAWPHRLGFASSDSLLALKHYCWSWRRMLQERARLRFDGVYFLSQSRLVVGQQEGRGMKEGPSCDYYDPRGKWSTFYRIWRFHVDGSMWAFVCSELTPLDVRKLAAAVSPSRPASLSGRLRGACWGTYCVRADAADGLAESTTLDAHVPLRLEGYPNMQPTTVRYRFELRSRPASDGGDGDAAAGCAGSELHLSGHLSMSDRRPDDVTHFAVPRCEGVSRHRSCAHLAAISPARGMRRRHAHTYATRIVPQVALRVPAIRAPCVRGGGIVAPVRADRRRCARRHPRQARCPRRRTLCYGRPRLGEVAERTLGFYSGSAA